MKDRDIGIASMRQWFNTLTLMGEIILQFVGILSSWEQEMIKGRTLVRLERSKSGGKSLGRKKVVNDKNTSQTNDRRNAKKSIRAIASVIDVSRGTVSNVFKAS